MRGEENTPKFNKEYLWNHWTNLHHVNTIWRETGSGKSKMAAYTHEMRIFQLPDLNESDTMLKYYNAFTQQRFELETNLSSLHSFYGRHHESTTSG